MNQNTPPMPNLSNTQESSPVHTDENPNSITETPVQNKEIQEEQTTEASHTSIPDPVVETGSEILEDNSLVKKDESGEIHILEFEQYANVNQMLQAAQMLINTNTLPNNITEPEQVVGIMKYGNELGVPVMTALNNINMIQGRPTLGVHLILAQLHKYRVTYQITEDFVAVDMGNGSIDARTTIVFTDHSLKDQFKQELKEYSKMDDDTKEIYKPILEKLQASIHTELSYYWSQAAGSGLTEKSNWQKDPRNMMRVRCLTAGARLVKPQALHGGYETTELAEAMDADTEIPADYKIET